MITGKQRSYLRGLANSIEPIIHIGKGGLTQNIMTQIEEALEARELIKIKLLDASSLDAKETANEICEKIYAEYVQSIGSKFVIYRQSRKNRTIILP